jgi:hypothetical protein
MIHRIRLATSHRPRPDRVPSADMPAYPPRHPVNADPRYVAALRVRVEAAGVVAVAKAARMTRQTVWRAIRGESGRRVNPDQLERIRRALVKVEGAQGATTAAMPPPIVAVRSAAHFSWIALADDLTDDELAAALTNPDRVIAAVKRRRK